MPAQADPCLCISKPSSSSGRIGGAAGTRDYLASFTPIDHDDHGATVHCLQLTTHLRLHHPCTLQLTRPIAMRLVNMRCPPAWQCSSYTCTGCEAAMPCSHVRLFNGRSAHACVPAQPAASAAMIISEQGL
jgi:hypothetical protein